MQVGNSITISKTSAKVFFFGYILIISVLANLSGCVSNKKIVLFQNKSIPKSQDYSQNSTVERSSYSYRIQKGDVLSIQMGSIATSAIIPFNTEQEATIGLGTNQHPYLKGYMVDDSGRVDLPTIGYQYVLGKTISEMQQELKIIARRYFSDPNVRIFLMNFNVTVMGEVLHPGLYPVYLTTPTIYDAIALAGDFSPWANREVIKVVRTHGNPGEAKVLYIDMTNQRTLTTEDYYLRPNDIIYIKPMKAKKFVMNNAMWVLPFLSTLAIILNVLTRK